LRIIGSAASVPTLAKMLGAADTADMARYALERIPGAPVDQALRAMLPKASGKEKIGIVNTLGRRKDAGAVAALRKLALGGDSAMAAAAAAALGQIADPAAVAGLAAMRPNTSGALRTEVDEAYLRCAEQMMEKGNNKGAFALFKELNASPEPEMIRIAALRGLAMSGGKDAVPYLAAAMKTGEPKVQAQAIRQMSAIPGTEASAALAQALAGMNNPLSRLRVLAALADRGDKSAVPVLLNAARDGAPAERIAALQGLGKCGDGSLVLFLAQTAAKDANAAPQSSMPDSAAIRTGGLPAPVADVTEQTAARESLYRLRSADVDKAIIDGIAGAESRVKMELIKAASERGIAAAAGTLLGIAKSDPDPAFQVLALRGYIHLVGLPDRHPPDETLWMLSEAMNLAKNAEAKKAILALLPRIASADALSLAEAAMKDPEVANEAKAAADLIRKKMGR
jgi:HEAT repeat protein